MKFPKSVLLQFISASERPDKDEIVAKKQLANSILEHLVSEGLLPQLVSKRKPPYNEIDLSESKTELSD